MESALDLDLFFSMFGGLLFRINVFFVAASFCFFALTYADGSKRLKLPLEPTDPTDFAEPTDDTDLLELTEHAGETSRDLMFGLRPVLLLETAGETSLDLRSEDCVDAL